MKTKFYGTLFLFLALTIHTYSDNVSVLPFSIKYGETKNVTIDLKNSENYTAFQMDLYLPKGLSIVMDGADYLVDLTARKSKTHTISCAKQSNGAIRIVAFSTTNALFSGSDSALVALTIKADDYLNSKDSSLFIRNISFVKVDSVETASQVNFPNAQTAVKLECFMTSGSVVYVPTAGQLASLVDMNADSLIVTGFINENDFYTMRDMPNLKYLNMEGVTIVEKRTPSYAFRWNSSLEEVIFPKNLTSIGDEGFYGCSHLRKVVFNEGLQSIENYAFYDCPITGELLLPSTLTSIGNNAFYSGMAISSITSLKVLAKIPPSLKNNSSLREVSVVYVPEGCGAAYRTADYWKNYFVIDGQGISVSVVLTKAGTLAEKALEQVENLYEINKLKVIGPMNDADWRQIFISMTSLYSIDLSDAVTSAIPNSQFESKRFLKEILLPEGLQSIGDEVFYNCTALTHLVLPKGLQSIGSRAFSNCTGLTSLVLPEGLQSINYYAFENCTGLTSLVLPEGLQSIGPGAFYACTGLTSLVLSEGLQSIYYDAFYYCIGLTSLVLPEGLQSIGSGAFNNCSGLTSLVLPSTLSSIGGYTFPSSLKNLTCKVLTPLAFDDDPFYYVDKTTCKLEVPSCSKIAYKLALYWSNFYQMSTYDVANLEYLRINGSLTLTEKFRPTNKPVVSILGNGNLTVRGDSVFSMRHYIQQHYLNILGWEGDHSLYTSLINESPAMRADSISFNLTVSGNRWNFISFPFDVKMSDIDVKDDVSYVIRTYDGAKRAISGFGSNWKSMTQDSILRAGEGYIIQSDQDIENFIVKAVDNANKNRLFSNKALETTLNEYPAEFAQNSSWNFIGNPFPCYFDIRYINYNAPITVWNGSGYTALSLTDDGYILKPMQAFFVQKPLDTEKIGFLPEGRQIESTVIERSSAMAKSIGSTSNRVLYNLTLSNETYSDQTRVVLNPEASMDYELTCDAAKFMSDNKAVPQLYSISKDGIAYAINERPFAAGTVALGVYVGEAGLYTIALNPVADNAGKVWLIDLLLQKEVDLSSASYSFDASAGVCADRFELRFEDVMTGVSGEVTAKSHVYAKDGEIVVVAEAGNEITVSTESGIVVDHRISDQTDYAIRVAPGCYIVQVDGKTFKVVVLK